jgi:adenylate cyclase
VVIVLIVLAVLAIVPFLVFGVGYTLVGPVLDRRRRLRNDEMVFDYYCGTGMLHRFMWLNRRLPADPRCKLCYVPFGGLGRVFGVRPSRKNTNFCRACFETVPVGGHEREVGVLFADLRGFTAWSGGQSPEQVATAAGDFYQIAADALMAHDAIIDKFVGDEVMALFLADMPTLGEHTCDEMLNAAQQLLASAAARPGPLGVGIGLHFGPAWVGNVGAGEIKDFTALGDVVNVASRLQGCAEPGQIVISSEVFGRLHGSVATAPTSFTVKGKPDPLDAHVISTSPV